MELADLDDSEFAKLVAGALEHMWDFAYLGRHPLKDLKSVQERLTQQKRCSHIDTGQVLNQVLQEAIESLRPMEQLTEISRERHLYGVLHKVYVEGLNNKQVAISLSMGERTLYRYSMKAIQVLAQVLLDWEKQTVIVERQRTGVAETWQLNGGKAIVHPGE